MPLARATTLVVMLTGAVPGASMPPSRPASAFGAAAAIRMGQLDGRAIPALAMAARRHRRIEAQPARVAEPAIPAIDPGALDPAAFNPSAAAAPVEQREDGPGPGASGRSDSVAADDGAPTAGASDQSAAPAWTLDQLVDRALRANPRVLGQQESVAQARAGVAAARWEYFASPQVQVERTASDHLITSSLSQPLYAFGRIGATVAAARAQSDVAESRSGEVRQDLAVRVLELYGQFASLTRQIAVLGGDIERHRALEAMIHRRVEAGVSAPVDLNLVQTRLNQSRVSRITLRARQQSIVAALSQIIGTELSAAVIHIDAGSDTAAPGAPVGERPYLLDQPGVGDIVQRSLDRNPAIRRAEAEIAVAEAETRRARTVMLPTIVARLENRTFTSGYPRNGLPTTRVTVGVSLSTGAGLSSLSGISAAEARARAAVLARDALRQDVTSAVIGALETFRAARKAVESLRQNRLVQEQTAQSYNRMFLAGKRSWLDVLNMVREQSSIERDLADAEVQLMVADYRLRIETGEVA